MILNLNILKIIDWFIPKSIILDDNEHRRLRAFVVSHLVGPITVATMCTFIYYHSPNAPPLLFYIMACGGILFFFFNFILKLTGAFQVLVILTIVQFNLLIFICAYFFNGHMSIALAWCIPAPLVTMFFTNSSTALKISMTSTFGGFFVLYGLIAVGHDFPEPLLKDTISIAEILSVSCATIFGTSLGYTFFKMYRNSETNLTELATKDSLTGTNNRRYFLEVSEQILNQTKKSCNSLSLMMLDIDLFKLVNDTYGHQAGDIVLKKFSNTCQKQLRDIDIFARIGGEEFAILLPNTNTTIAYEIAERLREAVERASINISKDLTISVTVSIGIAGYNPSKIETLDVLMKRADKALYKAKNQNRNQVRVY